MESTIIGIVMTGVGAVVLFLIIANAVKMAVKEALYEFKEDIIKELNLGKVSKDNKRDN
jgi:hypothetical protein